MTQPTYPLSDTEVWHWKYRDLALTREVEFIHDTVNMAAAYRSPVTYEDRMTHQANLDMARYLQAEAKHHVAQHDLAVSSVA